MKRLLVLVLALVMALSLAAPALAFTDIEEVDAEVGPELAIKLVDVAEGYVSVNFTAPPSNRGYLKNEVVCAVVSLFVPEDYDLQDDGSYTELVFTGDNVSVWQDDNFYAATGTNLGGGVGTLQFMSTNARSALAGVVNPFAYAGDMANDNEIILNFTRFPTGPFLNTNRDQTYHFAVFGKVVGDDAFMRALLRGTGALINASPYGTGANPSLETTATPSGFNFVGVKSDYNVGYFNPNIAGEAPGNDGTVTDFVEAAASTGGLIVAGTNKVVYYVEADDAVGQFNAGDPLFAIVTDKNFNCETMWVYDGGTWYRVNVLNGTNAKNMVGAVYSGVWDRYVQFEHYEGTPTNAWEVETDRNITGPLLAFLCEDIIWDVFGLNPALSGRMRPAWWAANASLEVEVAVEPWYAEITVPTEIELEPPKTGDVVSALGFVLVAIAGLAFVAVRKVKA